MALTDTFVKQVKHTGKAAGDKHADSGGMFLLVKAAGKYWRMDYAHAGKRKTLALGVYPAIALAKARHRRDKARGLLADGVDPGTAKREAKQADKLAAANTYEAIAREFHALKNESWSESHAQKWLRMNVMYLFPEIGALPISTIKTKEILDALRKVEAKGTLSTSQDLQQMVGQVFRFAVQSGHIEQSPAADLKGALKQHVPKHFAALIEPVAVGAMMRAIRTYSGQPATVTVNQNHNSNVQFATLAHELAHLFLGHLGQDKYLSIPLRPAQTLGQRELEAESTAYIVCTRNGVENQSASYLTNYVAQDTTTGQLDMYQIMRAAGQIETLLELAANTKVDKPPKKRNETLPLFPSNNPELFDTTN